MNPKHLDNETKLRFGRLSLAGLSFQKLNHEEDSFSGTIKELFRQAFPKNAVIDGLGFEISRTTSADAKEDPWRAEHLEKQSQIGIDWRQRLQIAAAITRLQLDVNSPEKLNSEDKINYLKSTSKPGDIIFVTGGGKHQAAFSELIDLAMRLVNSRSRSDFSFPFTHTMINIGDGTILDLSPSGIRRQTWEQAFLNDKYYDCLAIGRLECSDLERKVFINQAISFANSHPKYNFSWVLLRAPFEVRRKEADTSVAEGKAVCTDLITEAAKAASKNIKHLTPLTIGPNPLSLFENPALKIIKALNIYR